MIAETSCGAVLYLMENGEPKYVLVKSALYGFPKGHVEEGETEEQTALREIREETGVRAVLDTSFRRELVYKLPRKAGYKRVVLFLAECREGSRPRPSHEIKTVAAVPFDEALALLKRQSLREVLTDADFYIRSVLKRQ